MLTLEHVLKVVRLREQTENTSAYLPPSVLADATHSPSGYGTVRLKLDYVVDEKTGDLRIVNTPFQ
ncbi:MAG TPA: hypothetical protein VJK52_01850 [Candidatus Nanoarchaeia archaeon]|nr:hypothetical protein [Candidatus Nanoarchaeia archaeon]